MGRVAKLIFVEPAAKENNLGDHNKFYDMVENADGSITSTWGRVDVTSTVTNYKPGEKNWDTLLKSKLKKGYRDMTALRATSTTKQDFAVIGNSAIAGIVQELQAYANQSVAANYTISAEKVTPQMVTTAQNLMNEIVPLLSVGQKTQPINDKLVEIYRVIPRKMKKVALHLLSYDKLSQANFDEAQKLIADEQAVLDVMQGQAKVAAVQQNITSVNKTLIQAMGIDIEATDANDIAIIKKFLGPNANQFRRAFRVVNARTQDKYNKHVSSVGNKTAMQFWHGSRNENWWSIIEKGLMIRPTNVVLTGCMFGRGIYGASKAQKSIGYTSLRGSYWARGGDNKAFMALLSFHVGNQLHLKQHEGWMCNLTETSLRKKGNYDSVYAHGGADLVNDEFIVYRDDQVTISYLVEIA